MGVKGWEILVRNDLDDLRNWDIIFGFLTVRYYWHVVGCICGASMWVQDILDDFVLVPGTVGLWAAKEKGKASSLLKKSFVGFFV